MAKTITLIAAGAIALAPAIVLATPQTTQPPAPGSISPNHDTGQPGVECEDVGEAPGHSDEAPGGGSPFIEGDSVAGAHYAGEQPQNSKNTASVSQYDIACGRPQ